MAFEKKMEEAVRRMHEPLIGGTIPDSYHYREALWFSVRYLIKKNEALQERVEALEEKEAARPNLNGLQVNLPPAFTGDTRWQYEAFQKWRKRVEAERSPSPPSPSRKEASEPKERAPEAPKENAASRKGKRKSRKGKN